MHNIVIFGPPGAGKGTQSDKIIDKYALTHISTGDLFRKHISEGTELGKMAQQYMDEGNLVPDQVVIDMVDEKISSTADAKGFIFDGFPRTVDQASALDTLLEGKGYEIDNVISLVVDEEELWNRIRERGKTSGRPDDQDKGKFDNRMKEYRAKTVPVLNYYKEQDKVNEVYGIGSIEDIHQLICQAIDNHSS